MIKHDFFSYLPDILDGLLINCRHLNVTLAICNSLNDAAVAKYYLGKKGLCYEQEANMKRGWGEPIPR